MKCLYKLKWSEGDDEWHLCNPLNDDAFVMKFPDCDNFRRQADQPYKDRKDLYVVCMGRLSKCGDCEGLGVQQITGKEE